MKKLIALLCLGSLTAGFAFAGVFSKVINSNQSFGTTVSVPAAASCQQFGAAYYAGPSTPSITVNSGPLGYYSVSDTSTPNYFNASGSISAGNYSIYLSQMGSGYSGVTIAW